MDVFDKVKIGFAVFFTIALLAALVQDLCSGQQLAGIAFRYVIFYIPIAFFVWVKMLPGR